ncbi:site-specific integrase [Leucobacter iarius]|uniref:Tyr recombinase domain-containing protein n=1 Tax=Leucobacter iarius TaxID=333963 RepID=A0ABN2LTY1_9MICO
MRQTAQRVKGQGWVFGTPKSARSTREVPLLDFSLLADLQSHLTRHPKRHDPEALFWPGRAPGSREPDYDRVLDGSRFLRNHFDPAVKRAGLPKMRVHDLRHTAASIWLAAGITPYEVSRWMGHASVTTTDSIYGHLYPTDYNEHSKRFQLYKARSV